MMVMSQTRLVRKAAVKKGFAMGHVAVNKESSNPVRLVLTSGLDGNVRQEIVKAVEKIRFTGLNVQIINELSDDGKWFANSISTYHLPVPFHNVSKYLFLKVCN